MSSVCLSRVGYGTDGQGLAEKNQTNSFLSSFLPTNPILIICNDFGQFGIITKYSFIFRTIYVPIENAINVPETYDISVGTSFGYKKVILDIKRHTLGLSIALKLKS